jgi:hypothetical protein
VIGPLAVLGALCVLMVNAWLSARLLYRPASLGRGYRLYAALSNSYARARDRKTASGSWEEKNG